MKANEPAFPGEKGSVSFAQGASHYSGLSKREYFAGLAMQGIMANPKFAENNEEWIVSESVKTASALLAELEKEQA